MPIIPHQRTNSQTFENVNMAEIQYMKPIGKGSFGVVYKAIWKDQIVAVKVVETDSEVLAFENETKYLSKVKHPNIIQMFGFGSSVGAKCLVMEFAADGSLYQFLHCPPYSRYELIHSLSWLLQCAKAIAYMHSIKPRPVIHRDLKPLNMLLTDEKKVLKLCDFGTACDLRSIMTDNRGSTAWMAPEVIKGSNYNEKCDVYSWGMILWEILTRRIPFEDLGQTYRILWQVVHKVRPPLIQRCPKPIEILMKKCWMDDPDSRPTMEEVIEIIRPLYYIMASGSHSLSLPISSESHTAAFMASMPDSTGDNTSLDAPELPSSTKEESNFQPQTSYTLPLPLVNQIDPLSLPHSVQLKEGTCPRFVDDISEDCKLSDSNCDVRERMNCSNHISPLRKFPDEKGVKSKNAKPDELSNIFCPLSISIPSDNVVDLPDFVVVPTVNVTPMPDTSSGSIIPKGKDSSQLSQIPCLSPNGGSGRGTHSLSGHLNKVASPLGSPLPFPSSLLQSPKSVNAQHSSMARTASPDSPGSSIALTIPEKPNSTEPDSHSSSALINLLPSESPGNSNHHCDGLEAELLFAQKEVESLQQRRCSLLQCLRQQQIEYQEVTSSYAEKIKHLRTVNSSLRLLHDSLHQKLKNSEVPLALLDLQEQR